MGGSSIKLRTVVSFERIVKKMSAEVFFVGDIGKWVLHG